jgi:hypothetical protein
MEDIKPVEGVPVYKPSTSASKPVIEQTVVKDVAPQFVSVKGNMDPKTGVFVTEVRDGGNGKVSFQYPSKKAAAAYSRPSSEENMETETKSRSSNASLEGKLPDTASSSTGEENKPVKTSASADAVTDGTKDNS